MNWSQRLASAASSPGFTAAPSTVLTAVVTALLFGVALSLLYRLYYHNRENLDHSLGRGLLLMTPALATVFCVIQNSIALSLGVLGSLAFVRFRTPIKRAEDVVFIIFSLALALLCSVGVVTIAGALMLVLVACTYVRSMVTGNADDSARGMAVVTVQSRLENPMPTIETILARTVDQHACVSSRCFDGLTSCVLQVKPLPPQAHGKLFAALSSWDPQVQVNVFYPADASR